MSGQVLEWMETEEEKAERRRREKERQLRLEQRQREIHAGNIRMCGEIVDEFVFEAACLKAYMRDMGRRSKAEALKLAERAMHHQFSKALCFNANQNVIGGVPFHRWTPSQVPARQEVVQIEKEIRRKGTWIDRARKNVTVKFEMGQKDEVRHPRFVEDRRHYAGAGDRKKPRPLDGLGPSWRELYVGQRVTLTLETVKRRERYHIQDLAGVSDSRAKGNSLYKATADCAGVILDFTKDFELQTDITYQPGQKITNYVSFPGGGAFVRWELTREVTYNWTERLQLAEDGNEIDDVEFRTNLIEEIEDASERDRPKVMKRNYGIMDFKAAQARLNTKTIPEWMVGRLRELAMEARIRAHEIAMDRTKRMARDLERRRQRNEQMGMGGLGVM